MASPFLGVYTASYAYTPQGEGELVLEEGDLLYVLERSDDDWWKVKKKVNNSDDDEPVGLVPATYIEETKPVGKYKALYEYARQTEEEISFAEDVILDVYDATDPDWCLVGRNGEYGFAPANYIEKLEGHDADDAHRVEDFAPSPASEHAPVAAAAAIVKHVAFSAPPREDSPPPPTPPRPVSEDSRSRELPSANLASIMQHRQNQHSVSSNRSPLASPTLAAPPRELASERHHDRGSERRSKPAPTFAHSDSESDGPSLPVRRPGQPRYTGENTHSADDTYAIPPGFQTYPVQEVDEKKKKRAATFGIGATRVILLPDKSSRPREEWSVQHLKGYNSEGKHVFIDLEQPTRNLDLHAGSKDAAEDIINALSEIRGAYKQAGLDEVVAAATGGRKKDIGTILYDFQAKGDDEVSVIVGDEVVIIDATSEEWWLVERRVNGERGVVPASYIERGRNTAITLGIMASPADPRDRVRSQHSSSGNGGRSTGIPTRTSSLAGNQHRPEGRRSRPDSTTGSDRAQATSGKQKPDSSQVRQWTDRTGNFKVEAQFIGYNDGKINLHKSNGVKIAVPVGKMSLEDLEYVERKTGISLDEVKPVSAFTAKNRKPQTGISFEASKSAPASSASPSLPSSTSPTKQTNGGYDWFEFFLSCGVDVNNVQRYATAFERDSMDESVLEDIQPEVMRMLGLKEGDILRVNKKLDEKYGRKKKNVAHFDEDREEGSGLFSGPGGALKNNTRKGRPAPAVQTPGLVDPEAFKQKNDSKSPRASPAPASQTPPPTQPAEKVAGGFDDDAWAPKPTTLKPESPAPSPQPPRVASPATQPASVQQSAPTGAMGDLLSLTTPPLQPTIASPPVQPVPVQPASVQPTPLQPTPQIQQPPVTQPPPSFMTSQATGINYGAGNIPLAPPIPNQFGNQFTGINQPQNQYTVGRQRPMAPTMTGTGGLSIPPPPQRPGSAPQNFTPGMALPPLTPSFTGQPGMVSSYGQMGAQPMQFQNMGMTAPLAMQPTGQMYQNMNNGMMPQNTGMPYMNMVSHATGGIQQPMPHNPLQAPLINQPTGQLQSFGQQLGYMSGQPTMNAGRGMGVNSLLPPPLVPNATGAQQQFTGARTLVAQPTGPPPNVKFGVNSAKKLVPQPTGRADLTKATPDNPFGF
ncbi:SH3 domain-containing protein [Morchella snyderi]|nr:SH3 domain-containing protein [Morchella snyderi]